MISMVQIKDRMWYKWKLSFRENLLRGVIIYWKKRKDIIHTIIRIDNEVICGFKINNTIYSEYYNGLEFNVSKNNKANEFIDINIFIDSLVEYILSVSSYIKENKKEIFDDTANVQTNIKVRMMCQKY